MGGRSAAAIASVFPLVDIGSGIIDLVDASNSNPSKVVLHFRDQA